MTSYEILLDDDWEKLARRVTARLNDGWRLSGGVAIAADERSNWFVQAITKDNLPEVSKEQANAKS